MLAPDQMDVRYQSWASGSAFPPPQPWLFIQLGIDSASPTPVLFPDTSSLPSRLPPGVTGPVIIDGQFGDPDLLLEGQLNNFAPVGVASMPEPGSLALAASGGLFGLACVAHRRRLAR
jgi:hypothetical protein